MLRPQAYRRLLAAFALLLALTTLMPLRAQAQAVSLRRPKVMLQPRRGQGAPKVTLPAGRRGDDKCLEDREYGEATVFTPLVVQPTNTASLAGTDHPTLLVYVRSTSATALEVTLEDAHKRGFYHVQVKLPPTPGIVRVPLTSFPALAVGQDYLWTASVICESGDEGNLAAGIIRRVQLEATLTNQLKQASPLDRVALYAQAGIWYEAASTLDELRRAQPGNQELQGLWQEFLKSAGLGALATVSVKN